MTAPRPRNIDWDAHRRAAADENYADLRAAGVPEEEALTRSGLTADALNRRRLRAQDPR